MKFLLVLTIVFVASQAYPIEPEPKVDEQPRNDLDSGKPEDLASDDKDKLPSDLELPEHPSESELPENSKQQHNDLEPDFPYELYEIETINPNRHLVLLKNRLKDVIKALEGYIDEEDNIEPEESEESDESEESGEKGKPSDEESGEE